MKPGGWRNQTPLDFEIIQWVDFISRKMVQSGDLLALTDQSMIAL
jgi:hypothetical protein